MYARHLRARVREALADTPAVFLEGARQVGKSTLARSLIGPEYPASYLTLDDPAVRDALTHDPAGALAGLHGPVVLDEVQRGGDDLLLAIKATIDRDRQPGRFLLTGSANLLLLPAIASALVGRVEIMTLWPLSQGELRGTRERFVDAVFDEDPPSPSGPAEERHEVIARLLRGGYPEPVDRSPRRRLEWFRSYVTTAVERDVRELAAIDRLESMPRLLRLIASRSAQLLNLAEVSRSAALPMSTLRRYVTSLQRAFLIHTVPPWSVNIGKRLVRAPKVHLTDSGVASHLLDLSPARLADQPHLLGPILETFVVTELLKQREWSEVRPALHHLRTSTGDEVDIVLEDRAGRVVGIEVKAAATVGTADFRGLRLLAELTGERFVRGVVLHLGDSVVPFGPNLHAAPVSSVWRSG